MESITSKRSLYFYTCNISFLFFACISLILEFKFIQKIQNGYTIVLSDYIQPILFLILFFFLIYLVKCYLQTVPTITIDKKSIRIKNEIYRINNIKHIVYTGKQPFIYNYKEGAEITLYDGTSIYIYDEFYANAASLKVFLDSVINNRIIINIPINTYNIANENIKYFTQGIFSNIKLFVIILISCTLSLFLMFTTTISAYILFVPLATFVIITPFLCGEMYYFGISEKYFIIRNYVQFWKKDVYPLSFIREVVHEPRHKYRKGLRIITKNYRSEFCIAQTLDDNDWKELKRCLVGRNIKVRDEL
ncbi:hypothetical protein GR160_05320 [Flavobacterium sp. Sd200]|uniref:hypothetical protein n=1 Tax=Flavobacterium sp. Sd200 TaxID=2692211 RepID=UPI00136CE4BF|nr:hypothetical protein [Flavobacterium sp. Sd200]MXN90638.1 hypothetical protein [Flavobacterium sp. Sd200]